MTGGEALGVPIVEERPTGAVAPGGATPGRQAPAALPVALDLAADRAEAVRSWVEGVLGWQVVDGKDEDPVPAVLRLRDHRDLAPAAADGLGGADGPMGQLPKLPTVLLLPDGCDAVQAAATAAWLGPAAVLGWPSDRDRLSPVVAGLLETPRRREGSTARLIVGGSAGGVGTTTVALALGGLRAWNGTRTLAAVRGLGAPYRGVPTAALGGGDLWSAADRLPGIDALRAVRLLDQGLVPEVTDRAIEAVILDVGADPDCDVLVCRPDAAGLAGLRVTPAGAIVLVGDGAVPGRVLASAVGGRPILRVPWSPRVARAGATGRLPAGLPGAWVRALRPLVTELDGAGVPTHLDGARAPTHPGRDAWRRPPKGGAGWLGRRRRPRNA
jgi:hypothetical protein